jgi:hypothetical protein
VRGVAAVSVGVVLVAGVLGLRGNDARRDLPILQEQTGALLAVTSDMTLSLVDIDAQRVERRQLEQLAPGDPPLRLAAQGERLVFYGHGPAAGRAVHVLDPASEEPPRLLAMALFFLPAADEGHLWLVRAGEDGLEAAEMDLAGAVRVEWTPLPYDAVVAAVRSGLAFQDEEARLLVWDPRTRAPVIRLDGTFPLASEGDLLAWCDADCRRVAVTDVGAGLEQAVELPPGAAARGYVGAFSPGGRLLALPLQDAEDPDAGRGVLVVEPATGTRQLVAERKGEPPRKLGWTPDGERLLFHVPRHGLHSYRPHEAQARRVPLRVPGPVYRFAVLQADGR